MTIDPFTRRTALKLGGALAATGLAGVAGARRDVDERRLFGEIETGEERGARDVIPCGNYGLVSDGEGMTVVDWRNPGQPEIVEEVDAPGSAVNDVKVDGDLAGLANDDTPGGVQFYDVSDPENPEELASYRTDDTSFWTTVRGRGPGPEDHARPD